MALIAVETKVTTVIKEAQALLTAKRFVKQNTTNRFQVSSIGAVTNPILGMVTDAFAAGVEATVVLVGQVLIEAGGVITAGDPLTTDSVGRAVKATTPDQQVAGVAHEAAAASGDFIFAAIGFIKSVVTSLVLEKTDSDSPVSLENTLSGLTYTNKGAGAQIEFDLPTAPGLGFVVHFFAVVAQNMRIDPGATDQIYINGSLQANGKYVEFNAIGEYLTLVADPNEDWIVRSENGTFTVEA